MSPVLLISTGLATGLLSGIFGIGGGVILVPLLVMLFGMTQQAASGTSLVALLLPVGALGVWEYYREGRIGTSELGAGLIIALGILVGTFVGAKLAMPLPEIVLKRAFSLFLAVLAVKFWFSA